METEAEVDGVRRTKLTAYLIDWEKIIWKVAKNVKPTKEQVDTFVGVSLA